MYVGGSFTNVGGASRSNLAALSLTSAQVQPFSPVMNKPVRALATSASTLYVGGEFAKVGAASRSKLAAFSLASGAWTPAGSPRPTARSTPWL